MGRRGRRDLSHVISADVSVHGISADYSGSVTGASGLDEGPMKNEDEESEGEMWGNGEKIEMQKAGPEMVDQTLTSRGFDDGGANGNRLKRDTPALTALQAAFLRIMRGFLQFSSLNNAKSDTPA